MESGVARGHPRYYHPSFLCFFFSLLSLVKLSWVRVRIKYMYIYVYIWGITHIYIPLILHYTTPRLLHSTTLRSLIFVGTYARSIYWPHYTTLHYTTPHYTTLLHYTAGCQPMSLQYPLVREKWVDFVGLGRLRPMEHYTTLHYTTLRCTALHYTTLHYTSVHYKYTRHIPHENTTTNKRAVGRFCGVKQCVGVV